VPSNGTVVKIFTHPENDLNGEFYVHVRYDMDLMINSNAYEILLIQSIMMICDMLQDDLESSTFRNRAYFFLCFIYMIFPYSH
jgi:hypothetical protein